MQEFRPVRRFILARLDSPMRNFMARTSGKRRPKHQYREDGTKEKKFPNGVSVTVKAMVQSWIPLSNGDPTSRLSRREFIEQSNFVEVYDRIAAKYGGVRRKPKTKGSTASMLNDLTFGRHDLPYYKLRALAQFVGLPTGMFVLFTQCVSAERDARESGRNAQAVCLEIISGMQRIADAMKRHIEGTNNGDPIFLHQYDQTTESILPSMELLKRWSDLYNNRS